MSPNINKISFIYYLKTNSNNLLVFDKEYQLTVRSFLFDPFYPELNLFLKVIVDSKKFDIDKHNNRLITPFLLREINLEFKACIEHLIASGELLFYVDKVIDGE